MQRFPTGIRENPKNSAFLFFLMMLFVGGVVILALHFTEKFTFSDWAVSVFKTQKCNATRGCGAGETCVETDDGFECAAEETIQTTTTEPYCSSNADCPLGQQCSDDGTECIAGDEEETPAPPAGPQNAPETPPPAGPQNAPETPSPAAVTGCTNTCPSGTQRTPPPECMCVPTMCGPCRFSAGSSNATATSANSCPSTHPHCIGIDTTSGMGVCSASVNPAESGCSGLAASASSSASSSSTPPAGSGSETGTGDDAITGQENESSSCSITCVGGSTRVSEQCDCRLGTGGTFQFSFESLHGTRGLLTRYGQTSKSSCPATKVENGVVVRTMGAATSPQLWDIQPYTTHGPYLKYGYAVRIAGHHGVLAVCGSPQTGSQCEIGIVIGQKSSFGNNEDLWILDSDTKKRGDIVKNGDVILLKSFWADQTSTSSTRYNKTMGVCGKFDKDTIPGYYVALRNDSTDNERRWVIRMHKADPPKRSNDQNCAADFGQRKDLRGNPVEPQHVCPSTYPFCQGYISGTQWGECTT